MEYNGKNGVELEYELSKLHRALEKIDSLTFNILFDVNDYKEWKAVAEIRDIIHGLQTKENK